MIEIIRGMPFINLGGSLKILKGFASSNNANQEATIFNSPLTDSTDLIKGYGSYGKKDFL